jgi:hypothetical protein
VFSLLLGQFAKLSRTVWSTQLPKPFHFPGRFPRDGSPNLWDGFRRDSLS